MLIDYDLTEQSLSEIVARLRRGESVRLTLAERTVDRAIVVEPLAGHGGVRDQADIISLKHGTSADYLTARIKRDRPDGNGSRRLLRDDPEVLAMWREAVTNDVGTNQHTMPPDNVRTQDEGYGNSRAYTLRRLSDERPDLYERVVAKELSANAAAIEAGFRTPPKRGAAKLRDEKWGLVVCPVPPLHHNESQLCRRWHCRPWQLSLGEGTMSWKLVGVCVAASIALTVPSLATTDSLHAVLLPVENWSIDEGYCHHEVLAADHIGSLTSEPIIAEVLQRPHVVPALVAGRGFVNTDLNPFTADEPRISFEIEEVGESAGTHEEVNVVISIGGGDKEDQPLLKRAKLAVVASLNNIFRLNICAQVSVTIKGLPEQSSVFTATPLPAESTHTVGSSIYWTLLHELSVRECNVGRPLTDLRFGSPSKGC